jgi:hypothetical protein
MVDQQGFSVELIELLFSTILILLGSFTFQIAAIISGYSIYKEMESIESNLFSLIAGVIVFHCPL